MNEPIFFSFRKPSDWSNGTAYHLQYAQSGLQLTREQVYKQVKRTALVFPQEHVQIADALIAPDGRWYMLDTSGNIWRRDQLQATMELVFTIHLEKSYQPSRMIVNKDDVVVLYTGEHGSMLQSYQLEQAQVKWKTDSWYAEQFIGYELISDEEDGVIVIGQLSSSSDIFMLRFDAIGQPVVNVQLPQPAGANKTTATPAKKYQLLSDRSGSIFIFEIVQQRLVRWQLANNSISPVTIPTEAEQVQAISYHPTHQFWALIIPKEEEQGCELLAFTLEGQLLKQGKLELASGERIEVAQNNIYILNEINKETYTITPISETTYWTERHGHIGAWCSHSLDSKSLGTEWHKIKLNVHKKQDTQWNICYFASDELEVMVDNQIINLDDYIRDENIEPAEKLTKLAPLWTAPLKDAEDALLHGAIGRYLWIYIELIGSSIHSPIINSMDVYFPRSSYLAYLPSIYQRDTTSQHFLSRYLSIFQSMIEDTDKRISSVSRTLEGNQASGQSLRWLLGWLGIESEDYWTEEQLRELLREAPKLYSMRGTKYALETLVRIYTGHTPIILEYEQIKPLKENIELGEVAERLYAADPHAFNVLVKAEHVDTELKRVTLQHILEKYKPVFSTFKLVVLQPWVYMDLHSYLGMNTVLSEPTLLTLDGRSSMPHHTITIDVGQENRMDKHTRLGLNSRLE